jgi:hypothetical protein
MEIDIELFEQSGGGSIVNIIRCWPPRIPRRDRIQRHEMGVKGDDQSSSNRSGTAQDPGELGAPWSD